MSKTYSPTVVKSDDATASHDSEACAEAGSIAPEAADWIKRLGLMPHPEGGFFRRHYSSSATTAEGDPCTTAIYYLLSGAAVSRLHSLARQEEMWLWHAGGNLTVVELLAGVRVRATELGPASGVLSHTVSAGTAFGALLRPPPTPLAGTAKASRPAAAWALVTCVVSPGFDYADWQLEPAPAAEVLTALSPADAALLARLAPQPLEEKN